MGSFGSLFQMAGNFRLWQSAFLSFLPPPLIQGRSPCVSIPACPPIVSVISRPKTQSDRKVAGSNPGRADITRRVPKPSPRGSVRSESPAHSLTYPPPPPHAPHLRRRRRRSLVAISAGLLAGAAASVRGPAGPFEVSVAFLAAGAALAALQWGENRAPSDRADRSGPTIADAWGVMARDRRIQLVGTVQVRHGGTNARTHARTHARTNTLTHRWSVALLTSRSSRPGYSRPLPMCVSLPLPSVPPSPSISPSLPRSLPPPPSS
jgi:hypothetical protein